MLYVNKKDPVCYWSKKKSEFTLDEVTLEERRTEWYYIKLQLKHICYRYSLTVKLLTVKVSVILTNDFKFWKTFEICGKVASW